MTTTIAPTTAVASVPTTAPAPTTAPPAPPARRGVLQMLRDADAADRTTLTAGATGFNAAQVLALAAPLDRSFIATREQGRSQLAYLPSWVVIREANRIFGFDGWQRQTISCRCIVDAERMIGTRSQGREPRQGWGVTYTARVRITVQAGSHGLLIREGSGAGHGIDADRGLAHESALKEAETDAMKRALMTFGNPFGLALYDRQQREVSGGASAPARELPETSSQPQPRPRKVVTPAPVPVVPAAAAPAAAGERPLEATVISQLQATIRNLPAPLRDGFSKAFRHRFQIPADAATIADRILQQQHHDWIETWLVQHPLPPTDPPVEIGRAHV